MGNTINYYSKNEECWNRDSENELMWMHGIRDARIETEEEGIKGYINVRINGSRDSGMHSRVW